MVGDCAVVANGFSRGPPWAQKQKTPSLGRAPISATSHWNLRTVVTGLVNQPEFLQLRNWFSDITFTSSIFSTVVGRTVSRQYLRRSTSHRRPWLVCHTERQPTILSRQAARRAGPSATPCTCNVSKFANENTSKWADSHVATCAVVKNWPEVDMFSGISAAAQIARWSRGCNAIICFLSFNLLDGSVCLRIADYASTRQCPPLEPGAVVRLGQKRYPKLMATILPNLKPIY